MKKKLSVLLISSICFLLTHAESISPSKDGRSWTVTSKSFSYHVFANNNGEVFSSGMLQKLQAENLTKQEILHEVTFRGGYNLNIPMFEVVFSDEVRDLELCFESAKVERVDNYEVLVITQKDRHYPVKVESFIKILPEYDLMEKWVTVTNDDQKEDL
jgi:alpha-galactosidase